MSVSIPRVHRPHARHGWWWKGLLIGFGLWLASVATTMATLNTNLIPTLILLGSFLVPFCVVLFVAERIDGTISATHLMLGFFVAGVLGVLGASLLESGLTSSVGLYVFVGIIEELVKILLVAAIGWGARPRNARTGALLGATVGAGFAAFESAGYAFNAAITRQGIDLGSLLRSEVLRSLLAPVGHVLWTAILGAVLFAWTGRGIRVKEAWHLVVAFVAVALLHALWDSMSTIASFISLVITGNVVTVLRYGSLPATSADSVQTISLVFYVGGLIVTTALGVGALVFVLVRRSRSGRPDARLQPDVAQV
jgi:RsiW-degrading membrane proteinase PrsW (M82 family)